MREMIRNRQRGHGRNIFLLRMFCNQCNRFSFFPRSIQVKRFATRWYALQYYFQWNSCALYAASILMHAIRSRMDRETAFVGNAETFVDSTLRTSWWSADAIHSMDGTLRRVLTNKYVREQYSWIELVKCIRTLCSLKSTKILYIYCHIEDAPFYLFCSLCLSFICILFSNYNLIT